MPAKSENQQQLFGMALAYKRGEMKDASDEVKKLADSMSEKELTKYASTKHKGLPEKLNETINKIQKLMLVEDINGDITLVNDTFLDTVKSNIKSSLGLGESDIEEVIYDEYTFGIKIPFDKINMDKHKKIESLLSKYKEFINYDINGDKNNITYNFRHKEPKMDEGEVLIPTTDGTQNTASASEKMTADKELKNNNIVKYVKK